MKKEILGLFRKTEMFEVVDSIGVPHPYMITHRHVNFTADKHGGMLDEYAIESCERNGIYCGICRGELPFKGHEQVLLVAVKNNKELEEVKEELLKYMLSIKKLTEKHGFVGFAFIKA